MAQEQILPMDGSHLQLVIGGKFCDESVTEDEKLAVFATQICVSSATSRKEVKASFEKRSLNAPKMASSAEVWRKVIEEAASGDIGLHQQRVLSAGKKMVKFWPAINRVISPILQNLSFYQANANDESSSDLSDDEDDNLPFKAILSEGKGKKRPADADDDEEEEEEEEEVSPSEMSSEGGDHDEGEEEVCPDLISTKSKTDSTPPPKKKGRQAAPKKEYVIPGNCLIEFWYFLLLIIITITFFPPPGSKLVSIAGELSSDDNFAIFDISATKKIHFGNDPKLADLLEWTLNEDSIVLANEKSEAQKLKNLKWGEFFFHIFLDTICSLEL